MAKERVYNYNDAAGIKPKFVPDYELIARDDSGGPDWDPYTQAFGDGGYVTGEKAHLSAYAGGDDKISDKGGDEISSNSRIEGYEKSAGSKMANPKRPKRSQSEQEE